MPRKSSLWIAVNTPVLRRHRQHHQELDERLHTFIQRYVGGEVGLTIDLLIFIGDWLTDHIERYDKAYAPWVKTHGAGDGEQPAAQGELTQV